MTTHFDVDTFVSDGIADKRMLANILRRIDPGHRIIHKKEPSIVWRKEIVGIVEEGHASASKVNELIKSFDLENKNMLTHQADAKTKKIANIRNRLDNHIKEKTEIDLYISHGTQFVLEPKVKIISHNIKGENDRLRDFTSVKLNKKSSHIILQMLDDEYKKYPDEFGLGDKPHALCIGGFALGGVFWSRSPKYAMPSNFLWIEENNGVFAIVHPIVTQHEENGFIDIMAPCTLVPVLKLTC